MNRFPRNLVSSLGRKMLAAVAVVLIVAGGSFAFFAYRTGTEMLAEYGRDKAYTLAAYGRGVVELLMLRGENRHLEAAMRAVDSTGSIAALFLLRRDGLVTVSTLPDSAGRRLDLDAFAESAEYADGKFRSTIEDGVPYQYVLAPVKRRSACYSCHPGSESVLGYTAVKVSMRRIEEASMKHRTMNILLTVLTFGGVGAVISGALLLLVIRPVARLRQRMRTIERQLDRVVEGEELGLAPLELPATQDEISGLITAFNALVRRLNGAHALLHDLHRKQLEHADRLATTGEMAAGLAHEIRNPLAGVLGALQVIDADMSDAEANKPIVQEMMVQMERMNLAVNDLLAYARPTPPRFDTTDLNGILERTLAILGSGIRKREIAVEASLDPNLPTIAADKKLIQQVFWNLIQNAIQAMEPGGRLTIATAGSNGSVSIVVGDTGRGIPAADLPNIFKPFFTTRHQGTGLGLTISRRIVEAHRGTIALESVENAGTTCTVLLPVVHHEETP